jgi:hypothetical protein
VVGLARAADAAPGPLPVSLRRHIEALALLLDRLATVPRTWPMTLREHAREVAGRASEYADTVRAETTATATAILGATADDRSRLVQSRA